MLIAVRGYALTETVNGITWTYTIANGAAIVLGGIILRRRSPEIQDVRSLFHQYLAVTA